jgi:phosphoribosylformylglycinamidine synthase
VGTLADVSRSATPGFKAVGSAVFRLGSPSRYLGGSVAFEFTTLAPMPLPPPDYAALRNEIAALLEAHHQGLVLAAHDVSDGGTLAALAEMSFASGARIGVEIEGVLSLQEAFGEAAGFIVETAEPDSFAALCAAHDATCERLGETIHEPRLRVAHVLDASLRELLHHWSLPLLDFYDDLPQALESQCWSFPARIVRTRRSAPVPRRDCRPNWCIGAGASKGPATSTPT